MSKVRQIIKLYSQNMGKKKTGLRLGMSKNTVKLYMRHDHIKQIEAYKLLHPQGYKDTAFFIITINGVKK